MNYKVLFIAGLGTPEIILIFLVLLFVFAFFGGIIFLIYSLRKRRDTTYLENVPSAVAINIAIPTSISEDKNTGS